MVLTPVTFISLYACTVCALILKRFEINLFFFHLQIPNWFHFSCFFKKNNAKTVTDVAGFDSLRWEDQEKVKAKVGEGEGKSGAPIPVTSSASDDLLVEYAKSSRSKCKNCKEQIDKVKLPYDWDLFVTLNPYTHRYRYFIVQSIYIYVEVLFFTLV